MSIEPIRRTIFSALFLVALCSVTGCITPHAREARQIDVCQEQIDRLKQHEQLEDQLQQQLAQMQDKTTSMKAETQRFQIELLEKAALIQQLDDQLSSQQQMIDEAVLEVVRAKAKLRSIESRAEAASTMAETEIALKALKEQTFPQMTAAANPFDKAESFLKMSADEFKRENYGGALYLAGQARVQIRAVQSIRDQAMAAEMLVGEKAFRPPLPLILIKRSNLRNAPGLTSEVLRVLEKGTPIIGYSHKDDWIRIRTEEEDSGWVHQELIQGR